MREGWERVRLGDVADIKTGYPFKSANYCSASGGFRLLRGDNVIQRDIRWSGARYWPRSRLRGLDDYLLSPGDVVLAMDRPWIESGLKVSTVRADDTPSLLVQRVARLRAVSCISQEFLPWALYTRDFTEYIKNVHTGTAVPHISPKQISNYWFSLPPLAEQRRIAGVLGALDDLIETNERLVGSLDAIADAEFRAAWDGTSTERLSNLGSLTMGQSPPGHTYNEQGEGIPFHQGIRDFTDRFPADRVFCTEPTRLAERGDILIAVRAPVGVTNVARQQIAMGRGVAGLRAYRPSTTLHALRADVSIWSAHQGTGTVFSSINKQGLLGLSVPRVDDDCLEGRLNLFDTAYAQISDEIASLGVTRDELLPLLMSGAVSPGEIEVVA